MLRRKPQVLSSAEAALVLELRRLTEQGMVQLTGVVRQELLTGIRDSRKFTQVRDVLRDFPDVHIDIADYELAAEICNRCASSGMAWGVIDALLCAIALNRDWSLFTTDRHFRNYSKLTGLSLYLM